MINVKNYVKQLHNKRILIPLNLQIVHAASYHLYASVKSS